MTLVVLGWDGLDAELVGQYGLEDAFGRVSTIDTYSNPVIDEPHTRELWPSMITGTHPDEHGIHAVTEGDGVEWDSPLLNLASDLAAGVVPQSVRTVIGRELRQRNAGLSEKTPVYYRDRGLETVFDDGGHAVSIPNYHTDHDEAFGLDGTRDQLWERLMPDRSGEAVDPRVDVGTVYETLTEAAGKRLGHTLAAMEQGHGLVWTWFGLIDTVGHIAPAMDAPVERLGYQLAADLTRAVRNAADEDTTVVSVSDHGLQDGHHTEHATLAGDVPDAHDRIDHVFDVADWVRATKSDGGRRMGAYDGSIGEVGQRLDSLGYIDA